MSIHQANISNGLLSLLSADDFARLAPDVEPIELPRSFVFSKANEAPAYCYFPLSGVGSIVAISPEGQQAEVGLFGRDGMTPTIAALESGSHVHAIFMQIAGHGLRIRVAALGAALARSAPMRSLFTRYGQTLATQTAFTALSNAVHHVEERLARWILMCHDRTDEQSIDLTHDFLSTMLAVRRPSVTTALHVLEGKHLIISTRGVIMVRDREALEAFARDAYGPPEQEYRRLIGPLGKGAVASGAVAA
ncbi:MAG: Crp/Fnr family transcriptional regulator [Devosia sp.]